MPRRSGAMGKPVDELTRAELLAEQHRCGQMVRLYGNKPAGKLARKRLREVERRLAREDDDRPAGGE